MTTPNEITPIEPVLDTPVAQEPVAWEEVRHSLAVLMSGASGRTLVACQEILDQAFSIGPLAAWRELLYAAPVAAPSPTFSVSARGVGIIDDCPSALAVYFNAVPSAQDIRSLHDLVMVDPVAAQAQPDHFDGVGKLVEPVSGADGLTPDIKETIRLALIAQHDAGKDQNSCDDALNWLATQPQPSGNAPLHPVIREAIEATFEQREGWMTKIGAAVRHLPEKSQPSGNAGELPALPNWGAIQTDPDGKVSLWPRGYRESLNRAFIRGARAALAAQVPPCDDDASRATAKEIKKDGLPTRKGRRLLQLAYNDLMINQGG